MSRASRTRQASNSGLRQAAAPPFLLGFAEALIARLVRMVIRVVHDLGIRERAVHLAIELTALGSTVLPVLACRLRLHPATTACSREQRGIAAGNSRQRPAVFMRDDQVLARGNVLGIVAEACGVPVAKFMSAYPQKPDGVAAAPKTPAFCQFET
jgi:hypothetical protein